MTDLDRFSPVNPNRADALGLFSDSRIGDEPSSGYSKSRYTAALGRLVDSLMTRASVAKGENARGKRRNRIRPQEKSNTVRVYLKALEIFSYYSVAQYGRELEPREITTDVAMAFANWMAGEGPGPDIRAMYVRSMGKDFADLYEAVSKACAAYGRVSIIQIVEQMPPDVRQRLVRVPADPREAINVSAAHRLMGRLVRSFRTIIRTPSSAEIRQSEREVWSARERDPYTFRYTIAPRTSLATGSVVTHLSALSAVWKEMSKPSTPDESPLFFNPWRDLYANWRWRQGLEQKNKESRGDVKVLTHPIANAVLAACSGLKVENRRDYLAICMLLFLGIRAEELAGLLRSDLRERGGQLSINVLGKGSKVRNIDLDPMSRDALMLLTAKLEEHAAETDRDENGESQLTYRARYCRAMLKPEAPLVCSLVRWGCNLRSPEDRQPEKDALEPLDTSGVRALVQKVAERARVKMIATGEIRTLTDEEKGTVHPHAFRHYAATAAKEAGVDLMEIKMVLGHESIVTTEGYIIIPPQISSAFSAGVYQSLKRRGPLTAEQLAQSKRTSLGPLDDPTMVEWEPDIATTPSAAKVTPLSEKERQTIIESPMWAYDRPDGDATGKMVAYLPHGITATKFSGDVKRMEAEAERAVDLAKGSGDAQGYAIAVQTLANIRARELWKTFRIGRLSRLPWWAGRANRASFAELAPIISYAQVAAENSADSIVVSQLRALHDQFYTTKGPTAATALVAWVGEMLDIVGVQFSRAMEERKDAWIPFDAQSPPDASIVREHDPDHIIDWFARFGHAIRVTEYKSAKNRGNIAIVAMDTLPDWMWVPDPLTDEVYGLPRSERADLRSWIEGLQSTRPSALRLEQWIEQMTVRISSWAKRAKTWQDRNGKPWQWASEYSDREAWMLATEALSMGNEFDDKFPKVFERVDVAAMAKAMPSPVQENDVRSAITRLLASKGIDAADPSRARLTPVMRIRAGAKHMFDPALLTFDTRDTIVHNDEVRRWWYERYGTDSECVTRRALRTLWERRKRSARAQGHGLKPRHFDLELSAMIPCSAEIEERIRIAGWTPPATIEDTVKVSKIMWMGLTDYVRQQQGAKPVEAVPAEAVESFWSLELPDVVRLVEEHSPGIVSVVESTPEAEEALEAIGSEAEELGEQEPSAKTPPLDELFNTPPFEALTPETMPSMDMGQVEPSEADYEADREQLRAQRSAERKQKLSERVDKSQQIADDLAITSIGTGRTWSLDAAGFWKLVDESRAKWLVFSPYKGEAAIIPMQYMRRVRKVLARFKPGIWWSDYDRKLRFRWKDGKAGLNLYTTGALPQDESFVVIAFWKTGGLQPNQPSWTDPRPWAPLWPGYPMPDQNDATDEFVKNIPWPSDPMENPLHAAGFHACMLKYERWKRNGLGGDEMIPNGWNPGTALPLALRPELPHPIDFAFAIVRAS